MVMGVAFLLIGVLGFVPPLLTHPVTDPSRGGMIVHAFHGYLFGLFPVNLVHNLVHLLFGVMGVAMSRSFDSARLYARIVAVVYAVLAFLGLLGGLNTLFGICPIHGNDVWLHGLIAVIAAYFGFAAAHRADVGAAPPPSAV
jgi:hypothetical protein